MTCACHEEDSRRSQDGQSERQFVARVISLCVGYMGSSNVGTFVEETTIEQKINNSLSSGS